MKTASGKIVTFDDIVILFRAPDTLALYGIPYELRPGQSPGDLWRAERDWVPPPYPMIGGKKPVIVSDWLCLEAAPGWYCDMTGDEVQVVKAYLARPDVKPLVPGGPYEWARVRERKGSGS